MHPAPDQPVPSGPLAVRWLGFEVNPVRAGALGSARLMLENAGTAAWQAEGTRRVCLSYHWLDELGNPIVWDGLWTALPRTVEPGERLEAAVDLRGPIPPGPYRLAFDLVADERYWFSEVGNATLEQETRVVPRIAARSLAVRGADPGAVDALEEPVAPEGQAEAIAYLAPGCVPAPDWSTRILDAHEEGYAAVGGSIEWVGGPLSRPPAALAPWAPGRGRVPGFEHRLLCPSVVRELKPVALAEVEGLPALEPPAGEAWLYDGRITVRARPRSGRRRG